MKYTYSKAVCYLSLILSYGTTQAGHVHERPDSHAPIGVMGDHVMDESEMMLSYRYMSMTMDGNRDGTSSVATPLQGFMVSPLNMDMQMHMFGLMYGITDNLTLSLMVPVLSLSMDHQVNTNNVEFNTESSGVGDMSIAAHYSFMQSDSSDLLLNFYVSVPSGSVDEKDVTPASGGLPVQLPYPMQLGSGSYGITPGLTYNRQYDSWSWGVQGLYTQYIETNDNGYKLGDKLNISGWLARNVNNNFSLSARLNALDWQNIDGEDSKLSPMPTVPTKNPELRGGGRIDALFGVNYVAHGLNAMRIAAEIGAPVYQDLNGPQLETDLLFTLGAQYTF